MGVGNGAGVPAGVAVVLGGGSGGGVGGFAFVCPCSKRGPSYATVLNALLTLSRSKSCSGQARNKSFWLRRPEDVCLHA